MYTHATFLLKTLSQVLGSSLQLYLPNSKTAGSGLCCAGWRVCELSVLLSSSVGAVLQMPATRLTSCASTAGYASLLQYSLPDLRCAGCLNLLLAPKHRKVLVYTVERLASIRAQSIKTRPRQQDLQDSGTRRVSLYTSAVCVLCGKRIMFSTVGNDCREFALDYSSPYMTQLSLAQSLMRATVVQEHTSLSNACVPIQRAQEGHLVCACGCLLGQLAQLTEHSFVLLQLL